MASLTEPHWECISPILRDVFLEVGKHAFAHRFYLAGGTALGLQLGHRLSMDLDFFSDSDELEETSRREIITALQQKFILDIDEGGLASLHLKVEGEVVGFMGYSYHLLAPTQELEGVQLASLLDIGLMKLDAVAGRGMRKDFIDLYFIAQQLSLDELIAHGQQKYPDNRDFGMMSLTALTDFIIADMGSEIQTTPAIRWNDVRNFFKKEARRIGQQWFSP